MTVLSNTDKYIRRVSVYNEIQQPSADWQLNSVYWETANYPLTIRSPVAGLDTKNRFYKAYPGLNYNVKLAVVGGSFPYYHTLTVGPSGMTINAYTGEITWPNPTASGSPHSVTAVVYDQNLNSATVSWTITVTTSGFYFLDAVNGNNTPTGDGSIGNPWKDISDWYGTTSGDVTDTTYQNAFLYYKNGTYLINGYQIPGTENGFSVNKFLLGADLNPDPDVPNFKPIVWLNYPGHSPVINSNGAYIKLENSTNAYFDGLDWDFNDNSRAIGFAIASNSSHMVFRKSKFRNIQGYGSFNHSLIYFTYTGNPGNNFIIQDNEFYDVRSIGYGILGYDAHYTLIENNNFHDVAQHPISPKEGNQYWFIRGNYGGANLPLDFINFQYSNSHGIQSGHVEISYNRCIYNSSGSYCRINSNQTDTGFPVYVYRNNLCGSLAQSNRPAATNGPFYWTRNIIINGDTSWDNNIKVLNALDITRNIYTDNLADNYAAGHIDANGELTGSSLSTYQYLRGYNLPAPYDNIFP